jgi:hypothetical protein
MQPRQPFLHDLVTLVAAPTQVLSARSGRIGSGPDSPTAQGVWHADLRVLSEVTVLVGGLPGEHIATAYEGRGPDGARLRFTTLLRHVGVDLVGTPDPRVRMDRRRTVRPGEVAEEITIGSLLDEEVQVTLTLRLAGDQASMGMIREGHSPAAVPFGPTSGDQHRWSVENISVALTATGAELVAEDHQLVVTWILPVPLHGEAQVGWRLDLVDHGAAVVASPGPPLVRPRLSRHVDHRLARWLDRSLDDLDGFRMTQNGSADTFLAAGAPWFLTLFGRDSLWAARMLLPVDLAPARGTLRTLARLQGTKIDIDAAEEPGKIIHELRRADLVMGGMTLPARYYGTIDATPLWVSLLHDAWRAGLDDADVAELLPNLERALSWLTDFSDPDDDGFGEYLDVSGHGLTNQGWKDSVDSVRFHDGRIAEGAVALCEVQGYAYQAAMVGADLLDAFDRPGSARYRRWAGALRDRFRASFWCGAGDDRYPALALDGDKQRVDALSSNIGHLLGTGLLDPDEERVVATRLSGPALDSGLGLRTMAATDHGYAPLSYHCGSVWPHDTAITILGLHAAGLGEYAAGLVEGLLRASVAFEQRLPELWSGEGAPVPYPAACRPQAWSAAAAVAVADVLGVL